MGATWLGWFIPADEAYVAPPSALDALVAAFSGFAEPVIEPSGTLDNDGRHVSLYLNRDVAEAAVAMLFPERPDTPVSIAVEQYRSAEPWEEDSAQRICGACSGIVRSWAVCEKCGVEEDPQTWRMGPPLVLFRRSIALGIRLQGAPDLVTLPHDDIARRVRTLLGGRLEAVEQRLGCKLSFVPVVV